jgi:hypothetical protein
MLTPPKPPKNVPLGTAAKSMRGTLVRFVLNCK